MNWGILLCSGLVMLRHWGKSPFQGCADSHFPLSCGEWPGTGTLSCDVKRVGIVPDTASLQGVFSITTTITSLPWQPSSSLYSPQSILEGNHSYIFSFLIWNTHQKCIFQEFMFHNSRHKNVYVLKAENVHTEFWY